MHYQQEPNGAPVRDAASVVMLRDGSPGLEVFLLRRHGMSDVLGGAYVFPGGKVDREDSHEDLRGLLDAPATSLHIALDEPALDEAQGVAIWFAALREAFEETGVLYADGADAVLASHAAALHREGRAFDEVLAILGVKLHARALQPWSRWITPVIGGVMRKRFDTRFFLAEVPEGQTPKHDDHEATESVWLTPRAALTQYWNGTIELAPPQIMSLAQLARHATVASAIAEARSRPPPTVLPHAVEEDGARVMCYPGDAMHPVALRVMPGPTRLYVREHRFEPRDGFEALFADG